jgi:hypothetical protein
LNIFNNVKFLSSPTTPNDILCRILLFFPAAFFYTSISAQTPIWNANSFAFSRDTVSLQDMTGSTTASFTAGFSSTPLAAFPNGFTFHFGTTTYSNFTISSYGYIKLGRPITAANPTFQDTIISALYNFENTYTARYKLAGVAPNRRLTIEWSGNYTFVGPVTFQLWLYEGNGKIQFVYSGQNSYGLGNGYAIYVKTRIFNLPVIASLKSKPSNQLPAVNYSALEVYNYDAIAAKTRYTFQPDTVKPVVPGTNFTNVLPGCLDVNIKDSSVNETIFILERSDSGSLFYPVKNFLSTSTPTHGSLYVFNNTRLQPDSSYSYRLFASNGFLNSDSVISTIHTPMPMIYGVKRIPGDYTSINALVQDAQCKHLGPDLVIELQPTYSFSNEGNSNVTFNAFLQTKILRQVTIRPEAGSTLSISSSNPKPLFTIDSVKNIRFDGRAGGISNTNDLTIQQFDTLRPAVLYQRFADSGIVRYCNIEGRCKNSTYGLIYLGSVSGTVINNCKIGPRTGFTYKAIVLDPNGRGRNILIRDNEVFRFYEEAIEFRGGGRNSRVVNNRFYQPDIIPSIADINPATAVLLFYNTEENLSIDSNRIGGSSVTWGVGNWNQSLFFASSYSVINFRTNDATTTGYIRSNEIANCTYSGPAIADIRVVNGRQFIQDNRIGSADSINSIVNSSHHTGISVQGPGLKYISGNFISGLTTDYPSFSANQELTLIGAGTDSLVITGNDIGGSDNPLANRSGNRTYGISLLGVKNAIIRNNKVRGISSKNNGVWGIVEEFSGVTPAEKNMIAENNSIHHLQGNHTAFGIYANLFSRSSNVFSGNDIYALKALGPYTPLGANQPNILLGIYVTQSLFPNATSIDTSVVLVSENKIHSLNYLTPSGAYPFPVRAIGVEARTVKVQNNMIQLGIGSNGLSSDSLEMEAYGIDVLPAVKAEIEHNSIYIGGTGTSSSGINFPVNASGKKNTFISNNIIQIERFRTTAASGAAFMPGGTPVTNVVSNYNLWYSQHYTDVSTQLAQWKAACGCDSSAVVGNPLFINPTGDSAHWNLHLLPGSIADAAGTPSFSFIPNDIDGDIRKDFSPVDIGADAIRPCSGMSGIELQLSSVQDTIALCGGNSFNLQVNANGGTVNQYQWQRNLENISGATGNSFSVTQPGFYRVVGQLACGTIASKNILVTTSPGATISISPGDTSICAGSSIVLNASGANTYTWSPSTGLNTTTGATVTAQPSATTAYTVTGSTPGGCIATKTRTITMLPQVVPTVTSSFTGCSTSILQFQANAQGGGSLPSFQWYVNNVAVDTGSVFTLHNATNGMQVYVQLHSSALCANPQTINSSVITINCLTTSIPLVDGVEEFNVSPNPGDGLFYVIMKMNQVKKISFIVFAMTGEKLFHTQAKNMSGSINQQLDLRHLASGVYFLQTTVNGKGWVEKVVIRR